MTDVRFEEGKTLTVRSLTYLAPQGGHQIEVNDVAVTFTSGWACIADSTETFAVPRDRVVEARGIATPASSGRMIAF
jgi:hypothetical protein